MEDIGTASKLIIGTSGWSYKDWRGTFYPIDLPQDRWLEFYAKHFSSVEINNSFYRLPTRATFEAWEEKTPDGFLFSVKASRYLTHVKKLKEPEKPWERFIQSAEGLKEKLGPLLFQFPERWRVNLERLEYFVSLLPGTHRYVFEFRHPSWFSEEVYALLAQKGAALCIADSALWPRVFKITAPFTFIRMHGGRELYASEYSEAELNFWAEKIAGFLDRRLDVFVYFNNDAHGFAVKNAMELKRLLGQ